MNTETTIMLVTGSELMGVERIREALFKAGFKVIAVEMSGVRQAVQDHDPDLIVANLSGCEIDDLERGWLLRRLTPAPIVAIGSCKDDAFRIGMLEKVVDDFLVRPVNTREVVARVRGILRRTHHLMPSDPGEVLTQAPGASDTDPRKPGSIYNLIHTVRGRLTTPRHGQG